MSCSRHFITASLGAAAHPSPCLPSHRHSRCFTSSCSNKTKRTRSPARCAQSAQTLNPFENVVTYIIILLAHKSFAGAKSAMRLLRPWGLPPIRTRFGLRKSGSRGFHPPPKTDRRRNDPTGRLEGSEQASRQRLTGGKGVGRRAGRRQDRTDIRCRSRGHSSRHQRSRPRIRRQAPVRQAAQKPGPSPL